MPVVYLGLGSNIRPVENLRLAVSELRARFGDIELSSVYKSKPLGFDGADFLNLVARIETSMSVQTMCHVLEDIHHNSGRQRGAAKFTSRQIDIDLLLYDQLIEDQPPVRVPRSDVLEYSFVLLPLAEIAGNDIHPVSGRCIADHLLDFDLSQHPLTRQDLIL